MSAPAVFLDRDGTIIEDAGYLDDTSGVCLLPGAAEAIRRFRKAGYRVVVVSNQSGVARGLFDEDTLARVHARVVEALEGQGATLDGAYYCPYLDGPEAKVAAYRRDSELRKPKPGMLLQAARELDIDLKRSWMIGDSSSDVEAGRRAGCRTIRVSPNGSVDDAVVSATHRAAGLVEAAGIVENAMKSNREDQAVSAPAGDESESVQLLRRIHDQLDRLQRQRRQQDFSLLRLFGALLQMFAIVGALWGAVALFNDNPTTATARLTLACFLQMAALGAFALDRWR